MRMKLRLEGRRLCFESIGDPTQPDSPVSEFQWEEYGFPTLRVSIPFGTENREILESFERTDKISIAIAPDDRDFAKEFVGEVSKIEITYGQSGEKIDFFGQSPFLRLQQPLPATPFKFESFRELVKHFLISTQVRGAVIFDDDVPDNIEVLHVERLPALALLRQICFQRNLVFMINADATMRISKASRRRAESMQNVKTIKTSDMNSFKLTK